MRCLPQHVHIPADASLAGPHHLEVRGFAHDAPVGAQPAFYQVMYAAEVVLLIHRSDKVQVAAGRLRLDQAEKRRHHRGKLPLRVHRAQPVDFPRHNPRAERLFHPPARLHGIHMGLPDQPPFRRAPFNLGDHVGPPWEHRDRLHIDFPAFERLDEVLGHTAFAKVLARIAFAHKGRIDAGNRDEVTDKARHELWGDRRGMQHETPPELLEKTGLSRRLRRTIIEGATRWLALSRGRDAGSQRSGKVLGLLLSVTTRKLTKSSDLSNTFARSCILSPTRPITKSTRNSTKSWIGSS